MNSAQNFDRFVLLALVIVLLFVTVAGMYIHNGDITKFGESNFVLFCGALLALLNRELLSSANGKNGNGNGSGTPNPPNGEKG